MTELILQIRASAQRRQMALRAGGYERLTVAMALCVLALMLPDLRPVTLSVLTDAYLGVGVFVAATFALFFWLESYLGIDAHSWLSRQAPYEIPLAAVLGALPGCGGAVIVITQFAMGRATFGAVVAVLTSTMGDAAFLLIAQQPLTGLALIFTGFVAGTLSGYVVNALHADDFMRVERPAPRPHRSAVVDIAPNAYRLWACIAIPGLLLGVAALLQIEVPEVLLTGIGAGGCLLSIGLWALSPAQVVHLAASDRNSALSRRVALNTNYVTVWVVLAFLAFELMGGGNALAPLLKTIPISLIPLAGILVGFLPGCGPQIFITTLYLSGALPLSAQLGNAISNDGDALFPALAVAPRAALVATLYTAVPALIVAYGFSMLPRS
ncbi:MAG: putative manganese transporter [Pseudomonadota bacterium]